MTIRTKRIYALPAADDGYRVLVDRLWPRGLSRAVAAIVLGLVSLSPSTAAQDNLPASRGSTSYAPVVAREPLAATIARA